MPKISHVFQYPHHRTHLTCRAAGYIEKGQKLISRSAFKPFGDIVRNRKSGALQLIAEARMAAEKDRGQRIRTSSGLARRNLAKPVSLQSVCTASHLASQNLKFQIANYNNTSANIRFSNHPALIILSTLATVADIFLSDVEMRTAYRRGATSRLHEQTLDLTVIP